MARKFNEEWRKIRQKMGVEHSCPQPQIKETEARMGKYFGTDGIRGVVNDTLDAELAYKAGLAAATVLAGADGRKPSVMIARDTRISGDMLEAALSAGLCSAGADVTLLGVLPTPAAAYLTVKAGADMGVVISASHNPYEYNGIKMFGRNGFKLSDTIEEEIERLIDLNNGVLRMKNGALGKIIRAHEYSATEYIKFLTDASEGRYTGKIAVDCANGAASETARALFEALDVEFEIFSADPDGVNINDGCGSTYIERLQELMRSGRYDIGFAFDGDADRCLAVDERGEVVDGDMLLAIFTRAMMESGTLRGGGAIGTVVSNAGMEVFAKENGFKFLRADVGDKYVLEMMQETGCNLGGESSGHMIFSDDATTGDGQLTAVKVLNTLTASGKKLSELVSDIPRFPQVMLSYYLTGGAAERDAILAHPKLSEAVKAEESRLAGEGRVLIRPSGTEALIRVLVEAKTPELSTEKAENLINLMKSL